MGRVVVYAQTDPGLVAALQFAGGSGLAWGPDVPAALDDQVDGQAGRATEQPEQPRQSGGGADGGPARLLKENGYGLRGNAKTIEGRQHPDRDVQFGDICTQVGVPSRR